MIHIDYTGETRNPIGSLAPLDMVIAVGFGSAAVSWRDGLTLVAEQDQERRLPPKKYGRRRAIAERRRARQLVDRCGYIRLCLVEKFAAKYPHRGPYVVRMYAPLWEATWRRERPGKWVCVAAGEGFA